MQNIFNKSLQSFWVILALFITHRFLSFPFLNDALDDSFLWKAKAFTVGLSSDIWVSFVLYIIILILTSLEAFLKKSLGLTKNLYTGNIFQILTLVALFFHQSYVEFFRISIIPFHLNYIFDPEFISGQGMTVGIRSILTALLGLSFIYISKKYRAKSNFIIVGLIALCSIFAHNRNLVLKGSWTIPDQLQNNVLEKLYYNFNLQKLPPKLSKANIEELASLLKKTKNLTSSKQTFQNLQNILFTQSPQDKQMKPVATELKNQVRQQIKEQKKPLILVVLMESLRGVDVDPYSQKKSITPVFDTLAHKGIYYENMWSTGTVTRGGQEAVWCGYPGSISTSTMRNHPEIKTSCLPKKLSKTESFWFHGGDAHFDNQLSYWKKQNVNHIMFDQNFPPETPKTGWGVGDADMFMKSAQETLKLHEQSKKEALLGFILTVTNHIPWDLPKNAPKHFLSKLGKVKHDSYVTTEFSDYGLGLYVNYLKKNNLWDNTVLIVVGDHGNTIPNYQNIQVSDSIKRSKIAMTLSGGITEKVIQNYPNEKVQKRYTSQSEIAPFLSYLLDTKPHYFLSESLLQKEKHIPIISELEDSIYLPSLNKTILNKDFLTLPLNSLTSTEERESVLYYRSILHLINYWSLGLINVSNMESTTTKSK